MIPGVLLAAAELRGMATGLSAVAVAVLAAISINLGVPGQEILQSLRFHVALAMLPLPLLLWIAGARLRAVAVLGLVVLSLGQGALIVLDQLHMRAPYEAAQPVGSFSLLSYNVLSGNDDGGRRIADHIKADLPDVVVLLETPGIESRLPELDALYPTRLGCAVPRTCDLSLLTRLPVLDSKLYLFGPFRRERLITAQLDVGGQPVTMIALHLSKPYFDEFSWIELTEIRSLLRSITGPVVLAGDFNAAPWSESIARFAGQMGLAPGPTFPATWPVALGDFGIPIDNVFSRDGALVTSLAPVTDPMGSNHRGLRARIDVFAPL